MTQEQIIESYKKYCPKLKSAEMLLFKDIESIKQLEQFIKDGVVKPDDVVKAFKKANASRFCRGEVTGWTADIKWLTNPVNIDKVNNGNYDDKKSNKLSNDWTSDREKQLEIEQHQKNMAKLEQIRNDTDHKRWLEEVWLKKYSNLRRLNDA